jgi:hypothetical protein
LYEQHAAKHHYQNIKGISFHLAAHRSTQKINVGILQDGSLIIKIVGSG